MTIQDDVLTELKPQPYPAVRRLVRDGDLLLCSANDPFSRLIRWSAKSPWSHVAIAYRVASLNRVMVLESVQQLGVRTVPLSTFISQTSTGTHPYPGRILLARHKGIAALSAVRTRKLFDYAFSRLGDRFAGGEILRIGLRIALGRLDVRLPPSLGPRDAFICSEFVAKCFEQAKVEVPWDGLGFIAPSDFAADPEVLAIAQIRTR
jgi:hypothetical protein